MTRILAVLTFLTVPALVNAQAIASYELRIYLAGATSPMSVTSFLATAVTCNLTPPQPGSTVNPTRVFWDDPSNVGKVCEWTGAYGTLLAAPVGPYDSTLLAIDDAGLRSAESSPKTTWSRRMPPPSPGHMIILR